MTLQAEPFNARFDHSFASFRKEEGSKPEEQRLCNRNFAK